MFSLFVFSVLSQFLYAVLDLSGAGFKVMRCVCMVYFLKCGVVNALVLIGTVSYLCIIQLWTDREKHLALNPPCKLYTEVKKRI